MKEWLPAGTVIAHFRISSRISANRAGEVYQATEVHSGVESALKLLPSALVEDPQTRQRFVQLFASAALLHCDARRRVEHLGSANFRWIAASAYGLQDRPHLQLRLVRRRNTVGVGARMGFERRGADPEFQIAFALSKHERWLTAKP